MDIIKGRCWTFGDNIDTDLIIAARYLNSSDEKVLAKYVFEDANSSFAKEVELGDIVVGGENFGCGSSREHAPIAIKASGVAAVVAKSFARIFYRNAFNMGLPIFEVANLHSIEKGDILKIAPNDGKVYNITKNIEFDFSPIPPFMSELLECGGLIEYAKKELKS